MPDIKRLRSADRVYHRIVIAHPRGLSKHDADVSPGDEGRVPDLQHSMYAAGRIHDLLQGRLFDGYLATRLEPTIGDTKKGCASW